MMDFEKLKPFIGDFVKYYKSDLDNPNGGNLHVVIEDGNIEDGLVWRCQDDCEKEKDGFGYFLATMLRHFTEEERETLFENDWNFSALEKN